MKRINVIDLFAGGGGLSLGFSYAGFNIVAAMDNWEPAISLYKKNIKSHPVEKVDLSNGTAAKALKKYNFDIIIGGPPCQDFSIAGKRDESLGRANLTISFANIINDFKPKYFVMENVDRAIKSRTFSEAKSIFEKAGYGLTVKILNAAYCGAPQLRKRLFVIGELKGNDNFLSEIIDKHLSIKPTSIRDYFGTKFGVEHYYRHPRSYKRRGVFSIDEPSPTVRGVNRPVPKGYPGHPGDTAKVTDAIRPLTTKERSLIQTFPEDYKLYGTKTDIEQVIGNAVPVKLAEYVGLCLFSYIQNNTFSATRIHVLQPKEPRRNEI